MLREIGEPQRQRIRTMTTEERKKAMEDAPRRLGYEQPISGSDRPKEALRSHWGSPDGYGEEFWAQMRVKAAVDKGLLEMTGKPFSPVGRLTKQALALLRSREA